MDKFEKEVDFALNGIKHSPLARFIKKAALTGRLAWAICRAEFSKTFHGQEYCIILSDDAEHYFVLPEWKASSVFRFMKKRKFMRRPDMRERIVYSTR